MSEFLEGNALESTTVAINRTSTTVKGGRRLSFAALVVVGDRSGGVGVGYGKGRGVPNGIEKAQKYARRQMVRVPLNAGTIPHEVIGKFGTSRVKLIPASPGTGVIAGGSVRAVLEMAGVKDCLTKAYGSTNKINLCRAAIDALVQLRTREQIAALRGIAIIASTVDEKLEATKKYAVEFDMSKKIKGPQAAKPASKKGGKGRGRGRGDQPAESANAPAAEALAEGSSESAQL
jgi:small subunit ribosomal protein S5